MRAAIKIELKSCVTLMSFSGMMRDVLTLHDDEDDRNCIEKARWNYNAMCCTPTFQYL